MVRASLAINFIEAIPLCVNTISIYIYLILWIIILIVVYDVNIYTNWTE